jgi:hypothetical protein
MVDSPKISASYLPNRWIDSAGSIKKEWMIDPTGRKKKLNRLERQDGQRNEIPTVVVGEGEGLVMTPKNQLAFQV